MATALRHISECPVCMVAYDSPKALPCDHSLCEACVRQIKRGSRIKCPICNRTHNVSKLRPDFRLSQFLDALKEKENEQKEEENISNAELACEENCQLCCTNPISFRCEECQQWLCKDCRTLHLRSNASRTHTTVPIATKAKEIRDQFDKNSRSIKQSILEQSNSVEKLEDEINRLKCDQNEALRISNDLREKSLKDVNIYFQSIEARIIDFIQKKVQQLEHKKEKIRKQIANVQTKCHEIEELLTDDTFQVCIRGGTILDESERLVHAGKEDHFEYDASNVQIVPGTDWDASKSAMLILTNGGADVTESSESGLPFPALSEMVERQFVLTNQVDVKSWPHSLRLIKQELWSCQGKGSIQIFNSDLELQRILSNTEWIRVCDVTAMQSGEIIVADMSGLFQIADNGEIVARIAIGSHNSVALFGNFLYAYGFNPPRISIYKHYGSSWMKIETLQLRFRKDSYVTLSVKNNTITACSKKDAMVVVFSLTGQYLRSYGREDLDQLDLPYLCTEDDASSLLIAEKGRNRLRVVDKHGQWKSVSLEPEVKEPRGAVIEANKLYVTSRLDKCCYRLCHYTCL